jgi:hypothetical protein
MTIWKLGGLAVAAMLVSSVMVGQASAMPANGLKLAATHVGGDVQNVRVVCGAYRCWGTRGAYWGTRYSGYVGPGWNRWHRWGWNRWGWNNRWAWNRWGWNRPLYAYAGSGYRWGWRRPLYAYGGPAWGWRRPLYAYAGSGYGPGYGYGWRRPFYAAAGVAAGVGLATAAWDGGAGWNQWDGGPYYGGLGWNAGWNGWDGNWGWRGWGWRRSWW